MAEENKDGLETKEENPTKETAECLQDEMKQTQERLKDKTSETTENPQEEAEENPDVVEKDIPKFRGLYRHVKISVKALDIIIIVCVAVILIAAIVGLRDPGYLVTYDSQGGTAVEAVKYQYGELIDEPQAPTREGYTFEGWYTDPSCTTEWKMDEYKIHDKLTLYAKWEKVNKD